MANETPWSLRASVLVQKTAIPYIVSLAHVPYSNIIASGDSHGVVRSHALDRELQQNAMTAATVNCNTQRIQGISVGRLDENLIVSCTEGKFFGWDVRLANHAFEVAMENGELCNDVSVSPFAPQIACAQSTGIGIWDFRSCIRKLESMHSDAVTRTLYHPSTPHHLLSGSMDGTISLLDLTSLTPSRKPRPKCKLNQKQKAQGSKKTQQNDADDSGNNNTMEDDSSSSVSSTDDMLQATFNIDDSISTFSFVRGLGSSFPSTFSATSRFSPDIVVSVSDVGFVSFWSLSTLDRLDDYRHIRARSISTRKFSTTTATTTLVPRSVVGCFFHEMTDSVYAVVNATIGGGEDGEFVGGLVRCVLSNTTELTAVLRGGHNDVIRVVEEIPGHGCVTGGEDGRLCFWATAATTTADEQKLSTDQDKDTSDIINTHTTSKTKKRGRR